jgi:hypothetical protein
VITLFNFILFFEWILINLSLFENLIRCLEVTGADGVMSSEGLLGNPKMFSEEGDRLFHKDFARSQLQTVADYLYILQSHRLPRPLFQVVRSHLFKMLYRFVDAPRNADLRMQLATGDFETMKNVVTQLNQRMALIDYDTDIAIEEGLLGSTHWYYRHRDEKAKARILSIPRKRGSRTPLEESDSIGENSTSVKRTEKDSPDEISMKMKLLKLRLSEKKEKVFSQSLTQEIDSTGESESKSVSFSNFMSKVN